jgi:hypothetical protein
MSSIGAVVAASANPLITVVDRTVIAEGFIVRMRVPRLARKNEFNGEGKKIPFLQFSQNVRGGRVNFFVHTDDVSLRGSLVTASATVLRKTLSDGREYLYVDLVPDKRGTLVTHRLAVVDQSRESDWQIEGATTVVTPSPIRGVIVFAPPDTKFGG